MPEYTREQFADAVRTAISSVVHLYRELDNLMRELRDGLGEPPDPLSLVPGTLGKGGREGRQVMRHEYGALFRPTLDEEEVEEEGEDDDSEDEGEEDDSTARRMRGKVEIESDEVMAAIRVALYDSRKQAGFEPHLVYGVMDAWAVGPHSPASTETFVLARHMLRRIPRALASPDLRRGSRLQTQAKVYSVGGTRRTKKSGEVHLTCRLPLGVEVVPLYSLDAPGAVRTLADRIKAMWTEATSR
jgi:hypothetical protein